VGSLYLLSCAACYYGEDIHEGGGMSGAVYEPKLCTVCRRVVPVETSPPVEDWVIADDDDPTPLNHCPHCKGDKLEPWGSFGGEGEPQPGACPECGGAIGLESVGIWD
jgi:hypothetical protein